jgi:uncharacterized protein YfaS (alpha-2-macroglobulin family)
LEFKGATPGMYFLPPARAESMYHPEVYSVSGADRVEVVE